MSLWSVGVPVAGARAYAATGPVRTFALACAQQDFGKLNFASDNPGSGYRPPEYVKPAQGERSHRPKTPAKNILINLGFLVKKYPHSLKFIPPQTDRHKQTGLFRVIYTSPEGVPKEETLVMTKGFFLNKALKRLEANLRKAGVLTKKDQIL